MTKGISSPQRSVLLCSPTAPTPLWAGLRVVGLVPSCVWRSDVSECEFRFLSPGKLLQDDLRLVLVKQSLADPVRRYVPCYYFDMCREGSNQRLGTITLRVGAARRLRCPGHIGYSVYKRHRGRQYAARSCRLLLPLAHAHGLAGVWITCSPANLASRRTIEIAGGRYVETIRVPREHPMYARGMRYVRRYRIDVKRELCR